MGELMLLIFVPIAIWMALTDKRTREVIFGYLIMFGILGVILSLITGQGPYTHY